ncbi:MAG: hypothetical protein V1647_00520 [Pseudomonadota bacterium]
MIEFAGFGGLSAEGTPKHSKLIIPKMNRIGDGSYTCKSAY